MEAISTSTLRARTLLIFLVIVISSLLSLSKIGDYLNNVMMDELFYLRGQQEQPKEIVIVAIDEPSFSNLGMQWPWPRNIHGELIDALTKAGAETIIMDIIFAEGSIPALDNYFATKLAAHGSVVLAADIQTYNDQGYTQQVTVKPLAIFTPPGVDIGFVDLPLADDRIIRQAPLLFDTLPSLSYRAAQKFCRSIECKSQEWIDTLPSRQKAITINFLGGSRSIKTVSYYQALDPNQYLPKNIFKNKLVFVGLVTQAVVNAQEKRPDYFPIPLTKLEGGYMAGVEIHAHAAYNLLQANPVINAPYLLVLITGLLLALLLSLIFFRLKPIAGAIVITVIIIAILGGSLFLFVKKTLFIQAPSLILPSFLCYLFIFVDHYYRNLKEKRFINDAFGCYVSPQIVKQLVADPESLSLSGEQKKLTVLFSDIRNFTTISETMDNETLAAFMQEYLSAMSGIVMDNKGTVDKFIGDAVMAIWGAPVDDEKHAVNAVKAAMEMSERLLKMRVGWKNKGYPTIEIGVGINTGIMRVGNFGSLQRFDYTVIGDNVNLASRLEGATKTYGNRIIISESTKEAAGDLFFCRYLDQVRVKGKTLPVKIFEPLCEGTPSPEIMTEVELYHRAIELYNSGNFKESLQLFKKLLQANPLPLYNVYICRLEHLIIEPPPQVEWDGVFTFTSK